MSSPVFPSCHDGSGSSHWINSLSLNSRPSDWLASLWGWHGNWAGTSQMVVSGQLWAAGREGREMGAACVRTAHHAWLNTPSAWAQPSWLTFMFSEPDPLGVGLSLTPVQSWLRPSGLTVTCHSKAELIVALLHVLSEGAKETWGGAHRAISN